MFERTCYQKLDEPVLVWLGLEFREIALSMGVGAGVAITAAFVLGLGFIGIALGFGCGGGLICLFRSLRSGGPGYVFSRLYRLGLFEVLPPGLRPRHLLPLPGHGRESRFLLSAVLGEGNLDERRNAFKYFGR
jgi:hypothetical protein